MHKYMLSAIDNKTKGLDTQKNLRLQVLSISAPIRLSDFNGGTAELYDGYSTHTYRYQIALASYDARRICLKSSETNDDFEICPEFVRSSDPKDVLNELIELPLKLGQSLSEYTITYSNWGLG